MSNLVVNRSMAVLNLPKKVSDLIVTARAIQKSMDKNPNFPNAADKLTVLSAGIAQLETVHAGLKTNPATATYKERDLTAEAVRNALRNLKNDAQSAADANLPNAELIILSAGMSLKKQSVRAVRTDTVRNGDAQGEVKLSGTGGGVHQWQQSMDGGVTYLNLDPSMGNNTVVKNLVVGQKVWFRNRRVLRKGAYGEWTMWKDFIPSMV